MDVRAETTAMFSYLLRQELQERNRAWAQAGGVVHDISYGQSPCVVYPEDEKGLHGNFLAETYAAILANQNWSQRLNKVHTSARKSLPTAPRRWRELDSCNSSDALLMNVFCHPQTFANGAVARFLGVGPDARPIFGYRARVPFRSGRSDRTEVDMLLDDLLVEAKLTESDFQQMNAARVKSYRDLDEVFDIAQLPRIRPHIGEKFASYQLIRNVLAAHNGGGAFCLLCDARRPDLIESWYAVIRGVRLYDLRVRLKLLTWQELSDALPFEVQQFLAIKYGIINPSRQTLRMAFPSTSS